jgi:GntR family transcriptional regulator
MPKKERIQLQPTTAIPLHVQLERAIKAQIASGHWKAEEMIPSERQLMQLANVSRGTVRQAIASLIRQGFLYRLHGKGTFVTKLTLEPQIQVIYSFSDQIKSMGLHFKDRLLHRELIVSPPDLTELLEVPTDTRLIYLQRVRLLQGTPLMVNHSYIPYHLCPYLLTTELDVPLYQLLKKRFDLPVLQLTDLLECVIADETTAHHLDIREGDPLLYVTRTALTYNSLPIHVGRNFIRADMCRFRTNLSAKPDTTDLIVPDHE